MCKERLLLLAGALWLVCLQAAAAGPHMDFNGDGKADTVLRNLFTGAISTWFIDGTRVIQRPDYGIVAPKSGWVPVAAKDVNGDKRTDLLWYNADTGAAHIWILNGSTILQKVTYGSMPLTEGWIPVALEDFNGDGRADLLWYNVYTGSVTAWLLNGGAVLQKPSYGTVAPNEGTPIATKDFNGDGKTDILWRHPNTGAISLWLIDGTKAVSQEVGTLSPATGWVPIAVEDLNGDRRADVLWYNVDGGALSAWLLSGGQVLEITAYGTVAPNSGWSPLALADINGDRAADLLFYNANTGGVVAWLLNDSGHTSVSFGALKPQDGWVPQGIDDYNGDGRADLFWINSFTNATGAWLLSGSGIVQRVSYGTIPPSSVWQMSFLGG